MTLAWLYVGALGVALAASIRWRGHLFFSTAINLWFWQAINVNLAQPTAHWVSWHWAPLEAILMLATAAACVEAIERTRAFAGRNRFHLRIAAWAIPVSLVGFGVYFVAPFAGTPIHRFTQGREWLWVLLALALLIAELLVSLERVERPVAVRWHLRLLLVVMLSHAAVGSLTWMGDPEWQYVRRASRVVQMACCAGWVWISLRDSKYTLTANR